jgi:hypothetical protein
MSLGAPGAHVLCHFLHWPKVLPSPCYPPRPVKFGPVMPEWNQWPQVDICATFPHPVDIGMPPPALVDICVALPYPLPPKLPMHGFPL